MERFKNSASKTIKQEEVTNKIISDEKNKKLLNKI